MGPEGSPYQVAMSCLGTLVTFPAGRSFQVGGFNSRALSPGASADEVLCCLFHKAKKEFGTKSKFTNSNSKSHPWSHNQVHHPCVPPKHWWRRQNLPRHTQGNFDGVVTLFFSSPQPAPHGSWKPSINLSSVLTSLQVFSPIPLFSYVKHHSSCRMIIIQVLLAEPNPEDPLVPEIANMFRFFFSPSQSLEWNLSSTKCNQVRKRGVWGKGKNDDSKACWERWWREGGGDQGEKSVRRWKGRKEKNEIVKKSAKSKHIHI